MADSGRAGLGISGSDAIDPFGDPVGVIVVAIQPGAAAAKAGIAAGDLVTSVNQTVNSLADMQNVLAGLSPGVSVPVRVLRQDATKHIFHVTFRSTDRLRAWPVGLPRDGGAEFRPARWAFHACGGNKSCTTRCQGGVGASLWRWAHWGN